jgi:hypothetical protein
MRVGSESRGFLLICPRTNQEEDEPEGEAHAIE